MPYHYFEEEETEMKVKKKEVEEIKNCNLDPAEEERIGLTRNKEYISDKFHVTGTRNKIIDFEPELVEDRKKAEKKEPEI